MACPSETARAGLSRWSGKAGILPARRIPRTRYRPRRSDHPAHRPAAGHRGVKPSGRAPLRGRKPPHPVGAPLRVPTPRASAGAGGQQLHHRHVRISANTSPQPIGLGVHKTHRIAPGAQGAPGQRQPRGAAQERRVDKVRDIPRPDARADLRRRAIRRVRRILRPEVTVTVSPTTDHDEALDAPDKTQEWRWLQRLVAPQP